MYESADILDAARSIRPYLSQLLPAAEAEASDRQLADLLAQANTEQPVDNLILELLAEQDSTREWLSEFLQDKQQPEQLRSWSPLPGQVSMVNAAKFVCPQGDYTWYRPRVGSSHPSAPPTMYP